MLLRLDLSSEIARIHISGHVVHEDFLRAFRELIHHPDFQTGMNSVWDARGADFSQFSPEGLKDFTELIEKSGNVRGRARGALLVAPEEDSGLAKMYRMIDEAVLPIQIKVFRDPEAAESWIASAEEAPGTSARAAQRSEPK